MVSVGSDLDAYEKNNGVHDTRNGRRPRKREKEKETFLDSRGCQTDIGRVSDRH
jgi:hypothetical protein